MTIPHNLPQPARQPKIRSSCDGCGAVKGKCDRRTPQCSRCSVRGISCTYSISRKTGKPRKDRSFDGGNTTARHIGNRNGNNNGEIFNMDFGFPNDMLSTSLNSNVLPSLAFGESMFPSTFDTATATLNHFETYDDLDMSAFYLNDQHLSGVDKTHEGSPTCCGKDHDCHQEAQELFGTSLFTNANSSADLKTQQTDKATVSPTRQMVDRPAPARGSTPCLDTRNAGGREVSFDHVLLLNRKTIERLDSLLVCPCAASPYLMMLFASLISSIHMRCQHAVSSSSTRSALISQGDAVATSRISIGTFRVDDPMVESALNIQLMAGELRAVTGLIDKIALFECHDEAIVEQSGSNNLGKLYQNLALWLRDEHLRVTDMIKSRLRELNT